MQATLKNKTVDKTVDVSTRLGEDGVSVIAAPNDHVTDKAITGVAWRHLFPFRGIRLLWGGSSKWKHNGPIPENLSCCQLLHQFCFI